MRADHGTTYNELLREAQARWPEDGVLGAMTPLGFAHRMSGAGTRLVREVTLINWLAALGALAAVTVAG